MTVFGMNEFYLYKQIHVTVNNFSMYLVQHFVFPRNILYDERGFLLHSILKKEQKCNKKYVFDIL